MRQARRNRVRKGSSMARLVWIGVIAAAGAVAACSAGRSTYYIDPDAGPDAGAGTAGATSGGSGGVAGSGGAVSGGAAGASGASGTAGSSGASGSGGASGASGASGSGGTSGASGTGGSAGTGGSGGSGVSCSLLTKCTPNEICVEACGMCGTRSRLCDSTGSWLAWGTCQGEKLGSCQTGQTKSEACGMCGQRVYYCSTACEWLPGPCDNEGSCSQGAIQTTNASCPAGQVRAQFCDATCNWGQFSDCTTQYTWKTTAASPLSGRREFGFAWAGGEFYVVGGYGSLPTNKDDAAKYNPQTDSWTMIAKPPTARYRIDLVNTGTELVYWGGSGSSAYLNDGARYHIASNTWTAIPVATVNAPAARYGHATVWDQVGGKLIVWGGYGVTPTYKNDGALYDPSTNTWTTLPAAPIDGRYAFAYGWDPVRRWLYVWGGYGTYLSSSYYRADGAIYDASAGSWSLMPAVPSAITGRYRMPGLVVGNKFVVWGGSGSTPTYKNDGLVFDAVSKTWTAVTMSPLDGRYNHLAVTDGSKLFFFGGYGTYTTSYYKADGAVLDPVTLSWTAAPAGSLDARAQLGGAWTPSGILVWGGYGTGSTSTYKNDGALYLP
jgi:N-acetylneuraminic acid mutarotase